MANEKDRAKDSANPVKGVPAAASGMRITSFSERARRSEAPQPRSRKLPPRPGPLPRGGPVDPACILNPDDDKK